MRPPRLGAYPVYMVIAEKLEAIIGLGMLNSRLKGYFDLQVFLAREQLDELVLAEVVRRTFSRRSTPLPQQVPLGLSNAFDDDQNKQAQWRVFLDRNSIPRVPLCLQCWLSFARG